jgi:hypothetical protein
MRAMGAILGLAIAAAACGGPAPPREEAPPVPAPPADARVASQDAGRGTVITRLWPAEPTLGDSIWLRVEVEAGAGVTAELPFDQAALGRFSVLRYAPEPTAATYELAAPMSGRHRIPPLRVVLREAQGPPIEVLTDEIPIEVGAVRAVKTDAALHPARGALDPYVGRRARWPLALAGAAALAGLGGALLAWRQLARRRLARGRVSAWAQAMRRLAELEAGGAPAPDDAAACDAWFVELSAIVRGYVEGRFRLRAPELTTEEFLLAARRIPELTGAHRDLLGSFLARCDQVKFAGWRPEPGESLELLDAARAFVRDTQPRDPAAAPTPRAEVLAS